MAVTKTYLATEQSNWARAMAAKTALFTATGLPDPKEYAFITAIPSDLLTGTTPRLHVGGAAVAAGTSVAWKFYGTGGAGKVGTARIWGLSELTDGVDTYFLGDYLCELELTIGATAVPANNIIATSNLVDTVTVKADHTHLPGVRVFSSELDSAAWVLMDGLGYKHFILAIEKGDASGFGAMFRVF